MGTSSGGCLFFIVDIVRLYPFFELQSFHRATWQNIQKFNRLFW
nr:MAG TPA: hypothetical protein [Caudoviricetes sp.]